MRRSAYALLAFALIEGGCTPTPGQSAEAPASPPRASVTVVNRSASTITGQPLAVPPSPWEAVVSISDLPPGGILPMHRHPWPRYAFVERGRLSVTYEAAGITREFGPGEAVVEAIDQWHEGRVMGSEPVRLIVFDQLPPGASNVVLR